MDRARQRWLSAASLGVALLVLVGMLFLGIRQATAPVDRGGKTVASSSCGQDEISTDTDIARADVTVSVFNAGARKGFAQTTMDRIERAGFKVGEVGNAPPGTTVGKALVYTTDQDTAGAELVAKVLGGAVDVKQTSEPYGPGVDVFVGPKQKRLDGKAPHHVKRHDPVETCVKVD